MVVAAQDDAVERRDIAIVAAIGDGDMAFAHRDIGTHALSCAPVIGLLLVVQVPDASDVGCMAVLLRPFDCLALRLEGGKDVVRVVLDNIIIDRAALRPTLRPCL